MITLRPHQLTAISDADRLRAAGFKRVLIVLPTGSGKSLTLADYARKWYALNEVSIIFAHRDVLVSQLSEALCKMHVPHSFICSNKARAEITNRNLKKFGDSFHDEFSPIMLSSNPTFSARLKGNKIPAELLTRVKHWVQDEAHHVTTDSKLWGDSINSLINADGYGFTATPIRGDKKGLGSHADGVFDALSDTTNMWNLIRIGMLSPYKVYIPPGKIDLTGVNTTNGGDYNQVKLANIVDKRDITGNAVEHYLRVSPGQRVITFCVNISHAEHVAQQFNEAGIPSVAVSSKSSLDVRQKAMDDFDRGTIVNLVNVDLLGEGYDCPSVSTVIMLRPTQSYSLFKQQFGRCLRPAEGKQYGILLDHVGNVLFMMKEYGLQHIHDDPVWSLDRQTKRAKNDNGKKLVETMQCAECSFFFAVEAGNKTCPDCGHTETAQQAEARMREIQVNEGELVEMSVEAIDELLKDRNKVDLPMDVFARTTVMLPSIARNSALNNHAKRLHAQTILRHKIQSWCVMTGRKTGWSVDTVQREFEVQFGHNIFKAQTLGERLALELNNKIVL